MTDLPPEIQRDRDVERLAKKAKLPPYMWDTLEALAALGRFMDAAIAARPEEQAQEAFKEGLRLGRLGYTSLEDIIHDFEKDPVARAELEKASQWIKGLRMNSGGEKR